MFYFILFSTEKLNENSCQNVETFHSLEKKITMNLKDIKKWIFNSNIEWERIKSKISLVSHFLVSILFNYKILSDDIRL